MSLIGGGGSGGGAALTTYRKVTPKVVNTTVAETDLLNAEINVGANALGATGVLRGKIWGDWLQNSGAGAAGPRFRLKFGGTTVYDSQVFNGLLTCSNTTTRYGWEWDIAIANQNATNVQAITISGFISCLSGSATAAIAGVIVTGEGTQAAVGQNAVAGAQWSQSYLAAAINTTLQQALVFTVVNGSASATYETALQGALFTIF